MTIKIDLVMTGDLVKGGTTAEAQAAYIRRNDEAIRNAIVAAECYRERTSEIVDLVKLEITQITVWRRDAEKVLREIVRRVQAEEKQAAFNRSRVTVKGRPPKSANVARSSHPAPSATLPTRPPTILPPPHSPSAKPTRPPSHSIPSAAPATPLPPIGPRPRVTSYIRELEISSGLRNLLLAYVKDAGEDDLRTLYAQVEPDWSAATLYAPHRLSNGGLVARRIHRDL